MRKKKKNRVLTVEPVVQETVEAAPEPTELELAQERYLQTTWGMCSGVGYAMGFDQDETTPKQLRIGVNMALLRAEALLALLLEKDVFTELEWITTLTRVVENERVRYEALLTRYMGQPVELNRPQNEESKEG